MSLNENQLCIPLQEKSWSGSVPIPPSVRDGFVDRSTSENSGWMIFQLVRNAAERGALVEIVANNLPRGFTAQLTMRNSQWAKVIVLETQKEWVWDSLEFVTGKTGKEFYNAIIHCWPKGRPKIPDCTKISEDFNEQVDSFDALVAAQRQWISTCRKIAHEEGFEASVRPWWEIVRRINRWRGRDDNPPSRFGNTNVVELRSQPPVPSPTRRLKKPKSHVYFTENGPDFIKIGFSTDPNSRRSQLQTSTPYELRVVLAIPGTMETEKKLHKRFQHLRVRGEWFRKDPELLEFITGELKRQEAPPTPAPIERDWLHVATPTENTET
jgi:Meiotically up-regulated gene 113